MTHTLKGVSIDRIMVEHYLFDLGQPVEKTAEILDKDEEYVREIHDNYVKFIMPVRRPK
nr:MAG: hypothetical protein [Bacteriophage sp.]